MKRTLLSKLAIFALTMAPMLLLASMASAQQLTRLSGKVIGLDGQPAVGMAITITNDADGTKYTLTTDKDGKFAQNGMKVGVYTVNFKQDNLDYSQKMQITGAMAETGAVLDMNFKDIAAKDPELLAAMKKQEEAKAKFSQMKTHFDNGVHAMQDAGTVKQQLRTTTDATQKQTLQASLSSDYQTAITEFTQAQQGTQEKDPNLPTILGNLSAAYEGAGQYDKAAEAAQQSAAIKPTPGIYEQLGTDLAYQGKMQDASAACDKAASLDPQDKNTGEICYKNMGIVLTNAGKMSDAATPLKKATELNPNDAQAWYLLGNALMSQVDTKKEGGKDVYVIPPGTKEAYQKYLKLEPNGPFAEEAKQALAGLDAMTGQK